MKSIGLIGGGFSGTMTAVQLIYHATEPIEIILISEEKNFNRGIAYNPYSKNHLLNVPAAKMSAFPDRPEHFLDWVMQQHGFENRDRNIVAISFLPRYLFGNYLVDVWNEATTIIREKGINFRFINDQVIDLEIADELVVLHLANGHTLKLNDCVIASGNSEPRNPSIKNRKFFENKNYFRNPWAIESVEAVNSEQPVLIIGNGLTMVDTVIGLREHHFNNTIYSISPNGFNILPHRHNGIQYKHLTEELTEDATLHDIVMLFNKHIKLIRDLGLSAEPIIDSLRPHTQKIWQRLTDDEKRWFMNRLRHLWGVARHRIPLQIHDKLQQLRIDGKLQVYSGHLINMIENNNQINVEFYNRRTKQLQNICVSRVINCTGPESDFERMDDCFLKRCLMKGIITQDALKLGINTDTSTFQLKDSKGNNHQHLFTLGGNLKGMLWESTAVNELRTQANQLSKTILKLNT